MLDFFWVIVSIFGAFIYTVIAVVLAKCLDRDDNGNALKEHEGFTICVATVWPASLALATVLGALFLVCAGFFYGGKGIGYLPVQVGKYISNWIVGTFLKKKPDVAS